MNPSAPAASQGTELAAGAQPVAHGSLRYQPEIDGLRAIAVLPVVLFHAGVTALAGGFLGVDVFFVISGYLITSLVLRDITGGRFSVLTFYERRARRILPALIFVVLCAIPLAALFLFPWQIADFGRSVTATMGFYANQYFLSVTGYFKPGAEEQPLLHMWSLAVEEQYYLLVPPRSGCSGGSACASAGSSRSSSSRASSAWSALRCSSAAMPAWPSTSCRPAPSSSASARCSASCCSAARARPRAGTGPSPRSASP